MGFGIRETCGKKTRFTSFRERSKTAPCAIWAGKQKPEWLFNSPRGSTPDKMTSIPSPEKKFEKRGKSE
jgi:hypothetical protein